MNTRTNKNNNQIFAENKTTMSKISERLQENHNLLVKKPSCVQASLF